MCDGMVATCITHACEQSVLVCSPVSLHVEHFFVREYLRESSVFDPISLDGKDAGQSIAFDARSGSVIIIPPARRLRRLHLRHIRAGRKRTNLHSATAIYMFTKTFTAHRTPQTHDGGSRGRGGDRDGDGECVVIGTCAELRGGSLFWFVRHGSHRRGRFRSSWCLTMQRSSTICHRREKVVCSRN